MAHSEERNFRSAYYEKIGYRHVEEKRSLEILFKEYPMDRLKCMQFCLRFTVPSVYRVKLWKFVLQVTPRFELNDAFFMEQRAKQFEELRNTIQCMQVVEHNTSKPLMLLLIWLLEKGELNCDYKAQLDSMSYRGLVQMTESLLDIVSGDVERYFIARGLYQIMQTLKTNIHRLCDSTEELVAIEDPELFQHLKRLRILSIVKMERWFCNIFAGALHESALAKIWDKIVGGSIRVLSFVAVQIFISLRRTILSKDNCDAIVYEVKHISDEMSDVISNKSIDLWQKYGSPLTYEVKEVESDPVLA